MVKYSAIFTLRTSDDFHSVLHVLEDFMFLLCFVINVRH